MGSLYLEEVGEDLRTDSLLEDDLEDGGALAGEDVLTGPGLTQRSPAGLSSLPTVGVDPPDQALHLCGVLTQDISQGLHSTHAIVVVVVLKLHGLNRSVGTRRARWT